MKRLVIPILFILALGVLSIGIQNVSAELLGSTVTTQISFNASEVVTAADINVSVSNGTIQSISCGGDVFSDLGTSTGTRCVVFDTTGSTSGVLATVEIVADTLGTLTVTATGTLSTPQGGEPSSSQLIGGTYQISSTGSTSTPTATPTVGNQLPKSGVVENTLFFVSISLMAVAGGAIFLRKL